MPTYGACPDLSVARCSWLTRRMIAWPLPGLPAGMDAATLDWRLHVARNGGIDPWAREPGESSSVPLQVVEDGLDDALRARYPHLSESVALRVPPGLEVERVLQGQVAVVVRQRSGRLVNASGLQTAGVLDDVYPDAARARLGATWTDGAPMLRVWAPTALSVCLLLELPGDPPGEPRRHPMTREPDGCWSVGGEPAWQGGRYTYLVRVFAPGFLRVVENRVTDPYSVALTENSASSVLLDLDDPRLAPAAWLANASPGLRHPVDQTIYELHVRDFSMADDTLPEALRGTYLAFAQEGRGTRHLRALREAGLTTVQLLPISDNTSVEENRARQASPDPERLRAMPPDSEEQQRYVRMLGPRDGYNWGYDPWHHMVPEGSYATADGVSGAGRTVEVRTMVGALHGMGLRVVLDQVFNHTSGEGQDATSVLGRIVPGYYHRLDDQGAVERSTCCPNVATEHRMAEKLMVDAVVLWARAYRVDGFRFDLMGYHSRATMVAVRAALDALTPEADGVDGEAITMCGEGWNVGEVADNARFVQATQGQLGGTGIATFSDRLRDAVRGGWPFAADPRLQGFGSGLLSAPNVCEGNGNRFDQADRLAYDGDLVQLGLAGTLRQVTFVSQLRARPLRGDEIDYNGEPAGYADEPDEVVSYVDAHDNETLFDALTMKLPPSTRMEDRVRANTLCLACCTLGQSPVMWHAGTDFLRSKSLDRNSFDSGDWFNHLDFSMTDNGFGAGLPPEADNAARWPYMRPLLGRPELKPTPQHMRAAHAQALDLLRLRASSLLFRLGSAEQVLAKVSFPVSGTWAQTPGVIVMFLDDTVGDPVEPRWSRIAVVFNGVNRPVRQPVPPLGGHDWRLHPVQQTGADAVLRQARYGDGAFVVPGLSAAVFVVER